jgi:hypothetical protein
VLREERIISAESATVFLIVILEDTRLCAIKSERVCNICCL